MIEHGSEIKNVKLIICCCISFANLSLKRFKRERSKTCPGYDSVATVTLLDRNDNDKAEAWPPTKEQTLQVSILIPMDGWPWNA